MRAALIVLVIVSGAASQYGGGVAERVIAVRQTNRVSERLPGILPETDGYLAVLKCEHIGEVWYLRYEGRVYSFLVIDCAGDQATIDWMVNNHIVGEIDHEMAVEWGVVGRGAKVERVLLSRYLPE